jgi:hypothetical protein
VEGDECVERGMMVLLVKQVHLQNEGGAGDVSLLGGLEMWERGSQAANAANINAKSVKKIYSLAMIAGARLQLGVDDDGTVPFECPTIRI